MKIKKLIKLLKALPNKDLEIFLAQDSEGNSFNKIYNITRYEKGFVIIPDDSHLSYEDLSPNFAEMSEKQLKVLAIKFYKQLKDDPDFNYTSSEFPEWVKEHHEDKLKN